MLRKSAANSSRSGSGSSGGRSRSGEKSCGLTGDLDRVRELWKQMVDWVIKAECNDVWRHGKGADDE